MPLDESTLATLGTELFDALCAARTVAPLTERFPGITIDEAYAVQQALIRCRLGRGERIVGKKIGVTSKAVMSMLGVGQPDFGQLLDGMIVPEGSAVPMADLIQPKAEGEIAFVLKQDLTGPGVSAADVLAAAEGVVACIEIVDSRIHDWKIRIEDTVADNASCGMFVLGSRLVDVRDADLITCGMVLEKNGDVVVTGAGAATMNSPLNAVAWLANALGRLGLPLRAGEVILSGALGAMVPVQAGDHVRVAIGGLGGCGVRFV